MKKDDIPTHTQKKAQAKGPSLPKPYISYDELSRILET